MSKLSISLGTIIFWGFIGWFWFGDTITNTFKEITTKNLAVQVKDNNISIDVDQVIDNAIDKVKSKAKAIRNQVDEEITAKKKEREEEKPNPDEGKVMTAEDRLYESKDLYGDQSDKW